MRTFRVLFNRRFAIRVTVISTIIAAILIAWLKIAFPLLQLDALWKMLLAIPGLYLYFAVMLGLYLVLPEHVEIRADRILINHGESTRMIKPEAVTSARIVIFDVDRIRLRLGYTRAGEVKSRTVGVGRRVNLEALCEMLPVDPEIWDARQRYRASGAARRPALA